MGNAKAQMTDLFVAQMTKMRAKACQINQIICGVFCLIYRQIRVCPCAKIGHNLNVQGSNLVVIKQAVK